MGYGLEMDETTWPILSRLDADEMAALDAWIEEQKAVTVPVAMGRADAMRALTREALERMGLLAVRP